MHSAVETAITEVGHTILGKEHQIRLAVACLLAQGHLLIEDIPGVGKTTLAHMLARVLGLDFKRVQFTSDLLPADVIGVSIFQPEKHTFEFHPGPIFTHVVLADEINRATPKAQSALLEAMEERQVTADGSTRALPAPFFVIATQNPTQQIGTYPLPESQLDRFLMRIAMGYPDRAAERDLLLARDRRELLAEVRPALDGAGVLALQAEVAAVTCSPALLDYVQDLLDASRRSGAFVHGLSPRAGLGLVRAARAWAFLAGRALVLPEDVQAVAPAVLAHRLQARDVAAYAGAYGGAHASAHVDALLQGVPVP